MQESIGSFVRKGTPFDRDLSHDEPVYPSLSPLERERTHPSIVTRSKPSIPHQAVSNVLVDDADVRVIRNT